MSSEDPAAQVVPQQVSPQPDAPQSNESESAAFEAEPSQTTDAQSAVRAQMLARFEQWLDQTLSSEPPPRGVPQSVLDEAKAIVNGNPPGPDTDLYTLFSALTGLTGEIRLQGRAFKLLADLLTPLAQVPQAVARLEDAFADCESHISALSIDRVCVVMIDLYDRLQRGVQNCDDRIESLTAANKVGWFRRLFQQTPPSSAAIASVQAIRDASALTLARLQAAMQEWGVQRIGKIGERFDPEHMMAVDVRTDNELPPGTVLAVGRSGYAINGIVKAAAQVTVSKQE